MSKNHRDQSSSSVTRATAAWLALVVLVCAAPVGAVPITTFSGPHQFRTNNGPNSVGAPVGDYVSLGIFDVSPTAGTSVSATQGAVTRPLPFEPSPVFQTLFRRYDPFDPSLTGPWSLTATNGPDSAGPVFTNGIPNPQLVPLVENLLLVGSGATPTLTWTLPNLAGFDVDRTRIGVFNDATDEPVANPSGLPGTPTQFTIPSGLLQPGVPYIFAVTLNDDGFFGLENRSSTFTQSAYFVPGDLLVSSRNSHNVLRYHGVTGASLGEFVVAGAGGLINPLGLAVGPDGNLYVGSGGPGGGSGTNSIKRYDGTTGAFINDFTVGLPGFYDLILGPDGDFYAAAAAAGVLHIDGTTGAWIGAIGPGSPLNGTGGIAFGADGNLYVNDYGLNRVLRFNRTTGAYIDLFATVPIAGLAGNATDVRFGPNGDLLVSIGFDAPAGDIWRFDGTTGADLGAFIPPADPHPVAPSIHVIGPDGNLYISSSGTDEVLRYNGSTGDYIDSFASGGGLDDPRGLVFLPEPGMGALIGVGVVGLVASTRRRRRGSLCSAGSATGFESRWRGEDLQREGAGDPRRRSAT